LPRTAAPSRGRSTRSAAATASWRTEIAIALALQQPIFHSGQKFAGRLGYGNFDGSNALALSLAGVVDKGSFGPISSITLDGGVGFGTLTGTVAAKAGVTFGW
jgi:hypothetical protein